MAFEFVGRALRGATDILGGLVDEVGSGRTNREDDVVKVKRAFVALGRMEEPEDESNGIIDRRLDTAIRGLQRDKGLRVDGFMRPRGPTERSLQHDLRGTLGPETSAGAGFGPDRLRWPGRTGSGSSSAIGLGEAHERDAGLLTIADAREPEPPRLKPFLDKAERNFRRTAQGWREQGMTDAARHLEHFLEGSGEPIIYNRDQARSFDPVRSAEEDAQRKIRAAILERARDLKDGENIEIEIPPPPGEHGAFSHGLDLLRGFLGDSNRLNDNLAAGRTAVKSSFKGKIRRNGDQIAVHGFVDHEWDDAYDFHGLQPGAPAANSLERYRGAKPFTFGGAWRQQLSGAIERRRERLLPQLRLDDVD
jgi:hypothetical protein